MIPVIRPEAPADFPAIHDVICRAFGQEPEAHLVTKLRDGGYVRIALVAEVDRRVVGHVVFSDLPIITATGIVSSLSLAPMAVHPEYQNKGIGSELIRHGLAACRDAGHRIVLVVGHPAYYPRFGFRPELAAALESPFAGPAFMAAELVPGALAGVRGRVEYPPPFGEWT